MSYELKLIDEGGTTINLRDYGGLLADGYVPETSLEDEPLGETIRLYISGTQAQVQTAVRSVNYLLSYAKEHPRGFRGVWLQYKPHSGDELWQSRIYAGYVEYQKGLAEGLRKGRVKIELTIERDPYWDSSAIYALPLTNENGTGVTTGLRVYNCDDRAGSSPNKRCNWFDITNADIGGDMPSPLRLEITNQYNDAAWLGPIWLAGESEPYAGRVLEGEAAASTLGGTIRDNANYSGGHDLEVDWTGDAQAWLASWEITEELMTACRGRWVKVFAHWSVMATGGIRLQLKLGWEYSTQSTTLATSREVLTSAGSRYHELGEFQLPPWPLESVQPGALGLYLYAQYTGGSTVYLDDLRIVPVEQYRALTPQGGFVAYQEALVDDGINGELRLNDATLGWQALYSGTGAQMQVRPNRSNRFYIGMCNTTGGAEIARVVSVKAWHRRRRRGL